MASAKIFRINYKSDFILTLTSDAGWMTPFCIKFWTGAPSQAYYVGWDGDAYNHCSFDPSEPTKLQVQFDDHHLPIGDLKFQVAYHFTVADFPNDTEDEVINPASITTEIDGETYQVMLDFTGETAPEIQFSLPAYANEAQRIANEQQRIAAETQRIANEETRIANEQTRINQEQTRQQNEQQRINQEQARVNEYASLKADAVAATVAANDAAALANQKAQLAADKAALAQSAANLANAKAQLAADKAALAASAAQLANDKAALAQQKAEYAQTQGGYAKDQGDYAKAQGDTALADHQRAEADHGIAVDDHTQAGNDHTRAESDHGIAVDDHTQAGNDHTRAESDHGIAVDDHTQAGNDHTRAESDHGIAADDHTQAGNDHTRAESDHTRAESDHDAVELYVDSLGVFDLSKHNAVSGVLATYADLDAALNALNALDSQYKYGGMSFKFVQSSDNNYVQYRYMPDDAATVATFTNVDNWQGVSTEVKDGSKNLVDSSTICAEIMRDRHVFIGADANIKAVYKTSGEYITSNSFNITGFIPVEAGDTFMCSIRNSANCLSIAAFDSSKQIILASSVSGNKDGAYIVPEGVSFVRFGCASIATDSFNVVKEIINKSSLSLCTGQNYIDFDNFSKKLYIINTIQVKSGGVPITVSGNFEISYDWTTTSSKFVRLYYDLSDSTLKFGYYRVNDKNLTIAVMLVSGTESTDLKVIRVLSCALPYTIDGLREDQRPPVTVTKHIQLTSADFTHPHRYLNTGEMNKGNARRMSDFYKVLAGQKFNCILDQGTQNDLSVIAFDSELNVLTSKSYSGDIDGVYTVPDGVSYLRFGCSSTGAASASVEEIEKWIEEIDEVANSVLIPDYFDNQVSSQIANASNDIVDANINGDNFIFITDIHWERNNRNAPALIKHICDEMAMSQVIFGGDAIDGQAQQSVAMSYFNAIAKIKGADSNFLAAFGNHDANSLAGGTVFSPYNIAFYSLMQKPADRISVHNSGNITDYYIDNPTTNTRYIVLDTRTNHAFSTATSNWLTNVLTDTPNDMHIIIVLHSYMYTTPIYDGSTVIGYDGAISTAGASLNSILSNFTTKKIEAVFSGHMHMDYNGMTDNMVPVVVNDCDSKATSMWENVDGTVNGQSFDIVTVNYTTKLISCRRIGRGKSRLIHYTPYTLNVGETLDISSLLTIVPTSYSTRDNMLSRYLKDNPVPKTTFYSNNATISNAGIVTAVAAGYVTAVAENDDFIETFNIKIS